MKDTICVAADSLFIGEAICSQIEEKNRNDVNLFFYEKELLEYINNNKDVLIIIFPRLKDVSTFTLLNKIKDQSGQVKIVLIDNDIDRLKYLLYKFSKLCKGALFYDIGKGELLHCLSEVLNSREYISAQIQRSKSKNEEFIDIYEYKNFTKREKEVFELIANGYTSLQIADKLFISIATVNNHKANLSTKLNTSRRSLYKIAAGFKEHSYKIIN
ncbi:response regulator transcription factor [Sphingobacterium sp.]|uniref:response regulator transcription factor n=1 Tax=Sphingobacterium sp. TaxID=341027 RepID=UPI0031D43FC1